jgi:hypothetical protein
LATVFSFGRNCSPGGPLEHLYCLRCNRELEAGHKSVAVYMFADRRNTTAPEIGGPADMFLPSVLGLPGDGPSSGGRSQHRGVEYDPRSRRLGSGAQPRGMGKLARHCRLAACYGNRWWQSSSTNRRILRVLIAKSEPLSVERRVDLLRHRIHV